MGRVVVFTLLNTGWMCVRISTLIAEIKNNEQSPGEKYGGRE